MPTRLARRTTRRQRARAIAPITLAAACGLAAPAAAQLTEPFPAVFDLERLLPGRGGDGSLGFVLESVDPYDHLGAAVASAGDINGDGIDDLLVAAPGAEYCHHYGYPCYVYSDGAAYIVYGRDAASGRFPASIATPDADVVLRARAYSSHDYGYAVAPLGDINGDGLDDAIIGGGESRSYVIYGAKAPLPPMIELQHLAAGGLGFEILAAGWAASAGDVNGDGLADIILGGPTATVRGRSRAGRTSVFFGRDGGFPAIVEWTELDGTNGFTLLGAAAGDASGYAAASAGDINGDGVDDVIVGAPDAEVGSLTRAGTSYVVYGRASGVFPMFTDLAGLDVSDGFRLQGTAEYDRAGGSASAAGDINGDGVDDIVVGAPGHSVRRCYYSYYGYCYYGYYWELLRDGQAYVIFGRGGGGSTFPAAVDLSSLDGSDGFRLEGLADSHTGVKVARAGDVNGDGLPDIAIVETHLPPGPGPQRCYILYGRDTRAGPGFPAVVDLTILNGDDGFRIEGGRMLDAAAAGDINGDGVDDLVIGAEGSATRGAYAVFGRNAPCYADCDGSGELDFFDFLCFQNQFAAGDPQADCDESGELDFFDFLCFQNAFAAGCP